VRARGSASFAALVTGALAFAAVDARADSAKSADALFREGRTHADAGDFVRACPLFAESLRLDYALGTLFNLAACEEHVGALVRALDLYAELGERLPPDDDRLGFVRERRAYLDRVVPRLTIVVSAEAPPETHVTRDQTELRGPSLGVALPVDVGDHAIAVDAPGRAVRTWTVRVALGDRRVVVVVPGDPTSQPPPDVAPAKAHGARTLDWIVGGAGVASLAVGTYFGVRALSKRSDSDASCVGDVCRTAAGIDDYDDAKTYSRVSDVTLGLGIVAVAAASYLLLTSHERVSPAVAGIRFGPTGLAGVW